MTLIYQRNIENQPKTHALIIGVGRFPWVDPNLKPNRPACVDSAKAMVDFLVAHADQLEAPLATIECLLSDPRVDPNNANDQITHNAQACDPRTSSEVDRALSHLVTKACYAWADRAKKGDSMLLYCSSHGVAGQNKGGFLVLEDYDTRPSNPSAYLLDVASIAQMLPAYVKASSVWIFMDACQEILNKLVRLYGGLKGITPFEVDFQDVYAHKVKSVAVVGSPPGRFASAPADGGIAYFTEALLDGLQQCCVERKGRQWCVTGKQLLFEIAKIAKVVYGQDIETSSLVEYNQDHSFRVIDNPQIPMSITTRPEWLMTHATSVNIQNAQQPIASKPNNGEVKWLLRSGLVYEKLSIHIAFSHQNNLQHDFRVIPVAVSIEVP